MFEKDFDAGNIFDGVVQKDSDGNLVLMDEDGDTFNPQKALESLVGKKVRLTMISFEDMDKLEKLYLASLSESQV